MEVPCIAVPRADGEESRQALAKVGVLDNDHQIVVDEGTLYIPVTDPTAVPDRFETTVRELPARQTVQTPADILGYEPSLERLGDVVIVDEDDSDRAAEIAEAVMESDLPARSVLNRASKIKGELRVRDWELLAEREDPDTGRSPTETVHREYSHEFLLDLAAVYFSPRLATERHRVVRPDRGRRNASWDMFRPVSVRLRFPQLAEGPRSSPSTSTRQPSTISAKTPAETTLVSL